MAPPTRIRIKGKMIVNGKWGNIKILGNRKIPPSMINTQPPDRLPASNISPTNISIIGHEKTILPMWLKIPHKGLKIAKIWNCILIWPMNQKIPTAIRMIASTILERFSVLSFSMIISMNLNLKIDSNTNASDQLSVNKAILSVNSIN